MWQQDRWGNGSACAIGVGLSTDGGVTWQTRTMPFSHCGGGTAQNGGDFIRVSDPWVTFGPEGIVYQAAFSSSGGTFQPGSINSILASRSVDGGLTWSNPVPVITDGGDLANPSDVWSVVSRNGSVATGDTAVKQSSGQRIGDDTRARSYRAEPVPDAIDDAALRRATRESIVRTMEARVPGWSVRKLPSP